MTRQKVSRRQVRQAIIRGIKRTGEAIFDMSQQTDLCFVPVDKGFLKKSGYTKPLPNGIEMGYTTPYAARVEYGGPAIPYTGTQEVFVPRHQRKGYYRKGPKGTRTYVPPTVVSAHTVKHVDSRVIGFRPKIAGSKFDRGPLIFRVLEEEPAREGQRYLGRAVEHELPRLAELIGFEMQRLGKVTVRK